MARAVPGTTLRIVLLLLGAAGCQAHSGVSAQATTTVRAGHARFQFLTASLLRMEYAPGGTFVDAPSVVVLKRDWAPVSVQTSRKDGWLQASSSALIVRYRLESGPFSPANLEVSWRDHAGAVHSWHPGDRDAGNLGGLTYSLDNISEANLPAGQLDLESPVNDSIPGIDLILPQAKPGLLSRSGWAFLDDSNTPLWNTTGSWIEPRPAADAQDGYLFTYDRDYPQVLADYAQLCGAIPMVPRYVLGAWVTDFNFEYFPGSRAATAPQTRHYNQGYLEHELERLQAARIPFAGLVLDFAWHNYGWEGGYDWSPLFPQAQELLAWLRRRDIRLSLNDHPGYIHTDESILSYRDSHASAVLAALGRPVPPQPAFSLDLTQRWRFRADPDDRGLAQRWFTAPDPGSWRPIHIGAPWQAQGYPGAATVGWYRAEVSLPAQLPAALYLYLGKVDKRYRVFVNGREVGHSEVHWPQELTYSEITPELRAGQTNVIALRIESGADGGGLLRAPVALYDVAPPQPIRFDLADQRQAEVFMEQLHGPLMRAGVDVWWVDGGSGALSLPGLDAQLWTNKVFYDYSQRASGERAFILGRYGDWGSERYPGYFTGDTYSQWPVLAYEVAFSARGGNVLVPYISHDIGGFHGRVIDFELYARWLEFGTFSAILRMHSAHENPEEGNLRMPWYYGERGVALMRKYFTLRAELLPYLYTYTRLAHTRSLPLLRPLYLAYPDLEEAYRQPHEYLFGAEVLVAPLVSPGGQREIYLPPGSWRDFFTGRPYGGDRTFTARYAVDEIPVFVRDGAVVPQGEAAAPPEQGALKKLILNVYGSAEGVFDLYEDDGRSLDYEAHHAVTHITHQRSGADRSRLTIAAAEGSFPGQPATRSYELRLFTDTAPTELSVDGRAGHAWRWDPARRIATVTLPQHPIRTALRIEWR